MHSIFPQVVAFRSQLERLGCDYICNTRLPDSSASVSFLGRLHGHPVLWNMTLATLAHFRQAQAAAGFAAAQALFPCPFIEIEQGVEGVYPIRVGLDLPFIDDPVIKKSIIMIRNYKRLAPGKTEFCPGQT
jgi:acid phosphatase class B